MKIHVTIDNTYDEMEVHIYAKTYDEAVEQLMKQLQATQAPPHVDGYFGQEIFMVKLADVYTVYAEGTKVYMQTDEQEFEVKRKLYEMEELFATSLVRVSKSMLVNIDKISSIQLGLLGATQLLLQNGTTVHISRKYLKELKQKLGIGRE